MTPGRNPPTDVRSISLGESDVLTVAPGVAIDCCGREIVVSKAYTITDVADLAAWTTVANTLLNLDETVMKR